MKNLLVLLTLLFVISPFCRAGEIKFRDAEEGKIYQYAVLLAYHKANTKPGDKNLSDILKFLDYMRNGSTEAKIIKKSLVFGKKLEVPGRDVSQQLGKMLQAKATKIKDDNALRERFYIYIHMARKFVNVNEANELVMDMAKANGLDISLKTLLRDAPKPLTYDVEEEEKRLAREEAQRRADEAANAKYDSDSLDEGVKRKKKTMYMLLKSNKFK